MSQAQNKYPETSTSIIREVRGNRWLNQQRRIPVVPNHVEADSKSLGHGHSHGDDKPVIIVPETSTGTTMSGPSSTPCGEGAHNHEHAHDVEGAPNGQVIHFGCHKKGIPHTHVTNGNELSAEPHYPSVTPSMSYK